mmetsp:Transcript_32453/g.100428  ORF Transcript_32453/g.100428 Transcript_32453/m.100428 type:complete len:85 (+) Transcript_32453:2090-2344(+)
MSRVLGHLRLLLLDLLASTVNGAKFLYNDYYSVPVYHRCIRDDLDDLVELFLSFPMFVKSDLDNIFGLYSVQTTGTSNQAGQEP